MKNRFEILDFGAVADGVTDSTAAVQAALDAAAECCGTVLVPAGRYAVGKLRRSQYNGGEGVLSPDFGIVMEHCRCSVVQGNTLFQGAIKENPVLRGENPDCLVESNVGSIKK